MLAANDVGPVALPRMPEKLKSASSHNSQFAPACQLYPASKPPTAPDWRMR